MEISKSISFVTEDPRWQQKLMIGTGVVIASTVLPIIGLIGFMILAGYYIRLLQNSRDGQPYPLPEWDQWGEDLVRGFKLVVAMLVWAIPLIIFTIPLILGIVLGNEGEDAFAMLLVMCGSCFFIFFWLLLAVVSPAVNIAFAKDEQISSALRFSEIIAWTRENIGQVIVVVIISIAASIALNIIGWFGLLIICVGVFVTLPLAMLLTGLFQYHLYGQLAYSYPFPGGSGPVDPTLTAYTPPADMAPGVAPLVPPTGTDVPVADSADYPDSGVDNPAPPPPAV